MQLSKKIGIIMLMLWTVVITVSRALRTPNDFAEAHWLLDYQFGFVKRGLVGEMLSLITRLTSTPMTAQLISTVSTLILLIYCLLMVLLTARIAYRTGWAKESVLVSLIFLSSPFIVMSGHLNGYYDNIVIMLGVLSIMFLAKNKLWPAVLVQIMAVLVHENSMLLIFPLFCLTWLLKNSKQKQQGLPLLSFWPLLLPILTFVIVIVASESAFRSHDFVESFGQHLSQFSFIQEDRNTWVPMWISKSFTDNFLTESPNFPTRIASSRMYGLLIPTTLALLLFMAKAFRIPDLSVESLGILVVCLLPQAMHLLAWDTQRIWTYTILCAFLLLWVYSEIFIPEGQYPNNISLYILAIFINALVLTPLFDGLSEHFSLTERLFLYAPVLCGCLIFLIDWNTISLKTRLSLQGNNIFEFFLPSSFSKRKKND